jgi:polysaccharide biosynthesis protein PslJ
MTIWRPTTNASAQNDELSRFLEPQARERTPWLLALFCLVFTTLPSYLVSPALFSSIASPARVIAVGFFFLTALGFVLLRRATPLSVNPGVILIVVYLLILIAVWGIGLSHLGTAFQEANKRNAIFASLAPVGIALYTLHRVETIKHRSLILGCLIIGVTYSGVVGLVQHTTQINLADLLQPPGLYKRETVGQISKLYERAGATRGYGTFVHPIPFAVSCASVVPLALHFARYATSRNIQVLATIATGILLLAVPAAVARSGLIALAVALLVYARTFTLRQLGTAVVVFALVSVAYVVAAPTTAHALFQTIVNSGDDPSVLERVLQYARIGNIFNEHPFFGTGLGSITLADYGPIDNQWLVVMAEGGILGFVALAVLVIGGIFGITAALRRTTTTRERDQVHAMAATFLAILVTSTTFHLLGFDQTMFLFFLLFALLWSNCTEQRGVNVPMSDSLG